MTFREKLAKGPVLFDGAMGTYFAEKYDREIKACELANLLTPGDVLRVHREYIRAGCDCIKTNTFGANPRSLESSTRAGIWPVRPLKARTFPSLPISAPSPRQRPRTIIPCWIVSSVWVQRTFCLRPSPPRTFFPH